MKRNLVEAVAAVGLPLAWSNAVLPRLRLGVRGRSAANAGFATGYAVAFGGRADWWSARGLRYGLAGGSVVAAGYGVALAVPSIRKRLAGLADRRPEVPIAEWVAVHIPIGTVYSEELIFRATLNPLLDRAFGVRAGSVLGALGFGLWHIQPARAAGDSVIATVAATTLAGAGFGWLGRRGRSATAPALLHFAINGGGAIAPQIARRLRPVDGSVAR